MVDDVIAIIRKRKMEKEIVLFFLDYELSNISKKYPDFDSGFLYFFP